MDYRTLARRFLPPAVRLRSRLSSGRAFCYLSESLGGPTTLPIWEDSDGANPPLLPISTSPTLTGDSPTGTQTTVQFNGSFGGSAFNAAVPSSSVYTIYIVMHPGASTATQAVIDGYTTAGSGRGGLFINNTVGEYSMYAGTFLTTTGGAASQQRWQVLTVQFNSTSSLLRLNGIQAAAGNAGSASLSSLVLGAVNNGTGSPFAGRVAAIIGYPRIHSTAEMEANEGVLADHYKIAAPQALAYSVAVGTVSGDSWQLLRPVGLSDSTAAPMIIYCHGYGETQQSTTNDSNNSTICVAACQAGYRILSAGAGGIAWGNAASITNYWNAFNQFNAGLINTSRIIFWGKSMGGIAGQLCCLDSRFAGTGLVKGFLGTYPACSLSWCYNSGVGTFQSDINTAYNIPGGGNYATQTSGHDPLLTTASAWSGLRWRAYASSGDVTVTKADNSDAMSTHISGQATENTVVACSGGHGDPSHFQPSDYISFFNRCV